LVGLLLARGARIDARDHSGEQPIHYAAASGNVELIRFLLDSGVKVDAGSDYGRQPLHVAAGWGRLDAARFLLECGARINACADAIYGTPLHEAAGHAEMVSFLLARGANVNAKAEDGTTPLHSTAEFGHIDSAKILLDHGARIEASINKEIYGFESGGERPIHIAARRDRPEYIEFLLDQGACIDAPDARGNTPLDKAVFCGGDGDEAVQVLLRRGANLHGPRARVVAVRAAGLNDVEILRLLLDRGIDVNTYNERGFHLLHAAATCQQPLVSMLLARGARPDVVDDRGKQPIHTAAVRDNLGGVKALLAAGARIDALDHEGRQPIHDSAQWGRLDVVRFLMSHGADPNARDQQGLLPMDLLRSNLLNEWQLDHPQDERLLAKHRRLETLLVERMRMR
jgi:ankyrin repeat protein